MASKGGSYSRPSHSATAYKGSGGLGGNTSINKFTRDKTESLESIVNSSYKEISENLESRAKTVGSRTLLSILAPELYQGLQILEFLYKHGETIITTVENVVNIWSENPSSVTNKIMATLSEVLQGSYEIAKKEFEEKGTGIIAAAFAEQATKIIENSGVINQVGRAVGLENHVDRFKNLLEDTIEKQVTLVINKTIGDLS